MENSPSDCIALIFLKEIIHIPVQFAFHLILCGSKVVGEKDVKTVSYHLVAFLTGPLTQSFGLPRMLQILRIQEMQAAQKAFDFLGLILALHSGIYLFNILTQ